ncbi:hypothetical protein EZV62_012232 [Acer yangbiense]|uniref:AUGMIN subunit 8 n=1 Tax=Acer yangbiense TaxID=1000413 RepID=A0A5C7HVV7_9ROSI|nr:hypothetical protein EZV62_012232 [Acer yangbiense]
MDVCESERAPHKQSSADKPRQPLVLAEKNNALNAVSSRRLRTREVSSRYKSPTPSTASVSRRCPSPILTRTPPSNVQFGSKRALSAERKRPSTPPSPRPSTPVNESSVDTQFPSRRMSTGGRLPESLWPSTMRSLSVSFQSDTISIPVSKKEKPVPIVSFDRTLRPSSNVAHKQAETPTNLSRKPTLERKRSPLKGKSAPDQSENSKPVDGLHARLIEQHRWPSRIGGKLSSNALNKSVDLADKVVRNSATSVPGIGLSSLRRTPISDCGLSRPLQKSTSDGAARLLSLDYIGRVGSEAKAIDDNSVRISEPYKHMPTSSSEKSTIATLAARTQSLPIPGSPQPASPSRTSLLSASRGISPSRGRPSTPSSPSRGMSPSRIRSSTTTSQSTSSTSVLSFIADFKKGKKSANYIDDAHQLRLLYNRYLQWRFANARAEAVLYMQKVKAEIAYLDDWASLEREHISSLSGVVEDLEASTLRVPVNGGAKADIESLKTAVCSAVDVMQAMGSSICSLLSRVEEMNSQVSELAVTAAQEKTMLDECEVLLASTSAMQVQSMQAVNSFILPISLWSCSNSVVIHTYGQFEGSPIILVAQYHINASHGKVEEYSLRTHLIQMKEALEKSISRQSWPSKQIPWP